VEALVASRDRVLQKAAQIAGFAEARVVDTDTGKVVIVRHRRSQHWLPFEHLEPGECAHHAFFGCAFWERPDVAALYAKKEAYAQQSRDRHSLDVRKDFRRDIHKLIAPRPDGKHDLVEALGRMRVVRL
jgi:hypothetical protein